MASERKHPSKSWVFNQAGGVTKEGLIAMNSVPAHHVKVCSAVPSMGQFPYLTGTHGRRWDTG